MLLLLVWYSRLPHLLSVSTPPPCRSGRLPLLRVPIVAMRCLSTALVALAMNAEIVGNGLAGTLLDLLGGHVLNSSKRVSKQCKFPLHDIIAG